MKTKIEKAVVEVVNDPTRPPALRSIAYIKYPGRELQCKQLPDGCCSVQLALWGFEYKHRGPRPKMPPEIDTEQIRLVFNALLPSDLYVVAVEDHQTYINLMIRSNCNV